MRHASRIIVVFHCCRHCVPRNDAPMLYGRDGSVIDRIQQTEKSIVTVRTELTRVMPTTPPTAGYLLPHGRRPGH